MEHKLWYEIGKRDAFVQVLMLVRLKGEHHALDKIAQELSNSDKENPNPHAKWYLENHKTKNSNQTT